ncbi:YtxH domain-containing protein [Pedobacter psychrodurus]|uniref:YtxH domain-containing protein n=1 Tax=Pedobacter psychrodurus TaxID=2530456 RepID=A0A4R0PYR8_9SPHI|nr:YtxH domain-containing protein [Pedobacter psychrodurus]TCD25469.1 YtxH domain-containing protein [Pedobacter psychrodurus]
MNDNSKTVVALLAGLAAGAALGILFAPEKGEETVDKLSRSLRDLKDRVVDKAQSEIESLGRIGKEYADKAVDTLGIKRDEVRDELVAVKEDAKDALTDSIEKV